MSVHAFLIFATLLSVGSITHAQYPGKVDTEAVELLATLIGAPVFAADGPQIGEVADVSIDDEGRPHKIRVTVGSTLGLGARTLEFVRGDFQIYGEAVILDLPAETVQSLPNLMERDDDK